ncbi:MAG TPA: preprotein translocase subunit SecE [Candidatus Faecisoma merdavium]|nr:preprotein translocase subunit SecE [Candidatus Faecisoma merdavium]
MKEKTTKKVSTSKKEEKVSKTVKNTKKAKTKKESFFTGVKKEMGKVRWPLKKEMIKYSIATLSFIIFFALFFTLGDLIIAGFKMLVG